jgi:hypothetical protein
MKNLLFALCIVLACNSVIYAQNVKRYAVKSGYLKLEITGNTEGTKELWWDDFGDKTCEIEKSTTTVKMFGMKNVERKHTRTILVKDSYWTVNYVNKEAYKGKVAAYNTGNSMVASMSEEEREALVNQFLESMGGQKLADETIDNYRCEVFIIMGARIWLYKGIAIKSESKVMGVEINEMFNDFKPGTAVSASVFTPPSDVEYQDLLAAYNDNVFGLGDVPNMEDGSEEEEENIPVNYPFSKFKNVVHSFSYPGYVNRGVHSMDGMHACTLMKGMESIMIMAESKKNSEESDHAGFETFFHNGHKCYYGVIEDEDGNALIIDYPTYDMYIIIASIPGTDKLSLLSISDKLKF